MKFRKKPVEIEAIQFDGSLTSVLEIVKMAKESNGEREINSSSISEPPYLEIKTLEGVMRALAGDWIIKGVKGELYPCKPDIFAETYEAV